MALRHLLCGKKLPQVERSLAYPSYLGGRANQLFTISLQNVANQFRRETPPSRINFL